MTTEQAKAWAETKLNGRAVRNIEKYIRTCVENYSPRKPKAKPDRITPQQALDRIAQLAGLNGVRLIEAEPDVLGEVVVDRGGVELIAYAMEGEDTMTMYCLDDARSWPEDERRDYLPQPDDKANQIKPAEAVALAERFLAHAERLGYTEQDQ
jgi:hypothetical protein